MDVISSKVYCIIAIMGGLIDGVVVACDEQSAKDEVRAALDYVGSYGNLDEDYVACYSFDLPCADPAPAGHWEVALVLGVLFTLNIWLAVGTARSDARDMAMLRGVEEIVRLGCMCRDRQQLVKAGDRG